VNLVRTESGRPARVHNDFKRAQAACARIARQGGLIELAGQQRHLPQPDRRHVAPRRLTQGIRHEIAKRVLEQLNGHLNDDRLLAAAGLKYIPAKRGGAVALLERRDITIPVSDLQARINENTAALKLQRQAAERQFDGRPGPERLSPAVAQPETGSDEDDDHGIGH
jgi:hypothetical protein